MQKKKIGTHLSQDFPEVTKKKKRRKWFDLMTCLDCDKGSLLTSDD